MVDKDFNDDFKTEPTISKGFPTNLDYYLRVPKMLWRLLERQKNWIFILIGFKQLQPVSRERLVWMRDITILDPQTLDSRMCEIWQV